MHPRPQPIPESPLMLQSTEGSVLLAPSLPRGGRHVGRVGACLADRLELFESLRPGLTGVPPNLQFPRDHRNIWGEGAMWCLPRRCEAPSPPWGEASCTCVCDVRRVWGEYDGLVLSLKEEGNPDTGYSMEEPGGC